MAEGRNPFTNNPLRTIVVGESQDRVTKFAERSGAETLEIPEETMGNTKLMMKHNERWIDQAIKDNAKVLDIGIDPFRADKSKYGPSIFYRGLESTKLRINLNINPNLNYRYIQYQNRLFK